MSARPENSSPFRLPFSTVLAAAAVLALASVVAINLMGSWAGLVVAVVLIILIHAALLYALRASHSTTGQVRDHNFELCPTCYYDLRRSAPAGPCPECGRDYDKSALPALWTRILQGDPPPPAA